MFVLLFILGAALCNGYEIEHLNYGDQINIDLPSRTYSVVFFREGHSNGMILWSRSNAAATGGRGYMSGMYYIIEKSTQRDSGRYESRAINGRVVTEKSISVNANTNTINLTAEEEFRFDFNLEQDSCNIKFKPLDNSELIDVVYRGTKSMNTYYGCEMLRFSPPCEIFYEEVIHSCEGHFEVRDNYDNLAWLLELNVAYFDAQAIILPAVIIPGVIVACCCFLRRCFCKKSSKKDKPSEDEPVLLTRTDLTEQPETLYPAQPNASTGPLIHNPPANAPPSYSEASAPTVPPSYDPTVPPSTAPTVPPSSAPTVSFAPTFPSSSELDPRFELKSFTLSSYSPLSSETEGGVYHSDKLNF